MIILLLDKVLEEKGISRYELAKRTGITFQIIDNYYKNKVVRYDSYVLDRICSAINCDIKDLLKRVWFEIKKGAIRNRTFLYWFFCQIVI